MQGGGPPGGTRGGPIQTNQGAFRYTTSLTYTSLHYTEPDIIRYILLGLITYQKFPTLNDYPESDNRKMVNTGNNKIAKISLTNFSSDIDG